MLLQISEPGASTPKAACRERVVGIDLGTTNSLVATVLDAQPTVLTGGADAIVPSVVSYDGAEAVVGRAAVARGEANPVDTVASVKRLMGRSLADVAAVAPLLPNQLIDDAGRMVKLRFSDGRERSPGAGVGGDPRRAAPPRRGRSRRPAGRRGDHRAGVLRRRPAPGHPRRRPAGRPRGAAAAGRADRGGAGLRARSRHPRHLRDLRPRRRHLRHLDPDPGRRRLRGAVDRRRLGAGRRRSRPRDRPGRAGRGRRGRRRSRRGARGGRRGRGPPRRR